MIYVIKLVKMSGKAEKYVAVKYKAVIVVNSRTITVILAGIVKVFLLELQ